MEFKLGQQHQKGEYSNILTFLNMQTLHTRRLTSDLTFLHGVINSSIDNSAILEKLSFLISPPEIRNTRSKQIFRISSFATNLARNHPLRRMMLVVNDLCKHETFNLFDSSKQVFKKNLRLILK